MCGNLLKNLQLPAIVQSRNQKFKIGNEEVSRYGLGGMKDNSISKNGFKFMIAQIIYFHSHVSLAITRVNILRARL